MRSVLPMRAAKIGYIVMSAALCVLGILLICLPEVFSGLIGVLIGIILIVFGAVRMAGFFYDLYRLAFQHDLTSGIILIALGVIVLINPASLMIFVCSAMGLFFLLDGVLKIQTAFEAKKLARQMVADFRDGGHYRFTRVWRSC